MICEVTSLMAVLLRGLKLLPDFPKENNYPVTISALVDFILYLVSTRRFTPAIVLWTMSIGIYGG
jgi:uncharacterized membrane protein